MGSTSVTMNHYQIHHHEDPLAMSTVQKHMNRGHVQKELLAI